MSTKKASETVDRSEDAVLEDAALWVARIESGSLEKESWREFFAWLNDDVRNRDCLVRIAVFSSNVERLLECEEEFSKANIVRRLSIHIQGLISRSSPRFGVAQYVAVFLVLVVGLFVVFSEQVFPTGELYRTNQGEQKSVILVDGSRIHLNTDTSIRADYSTTKRSISLIKGEAIFDVVPDAERVFEVVSGNSVILAIGTSFVVRKKNDDSIYVAVINGVVQVRQATINSTVPKEPETRLDRGKMVSLNRSGSTGIVSSANIFELTAWRDGKLVFNQTPVWQVVEEINRYSSKKIVVLDAGLKKQEITGVFHAGDTKGILSVFDEYYRIDSVEVAGRTVVYDSQSDNSREFDK